MPRAEFLTNKEIFEMRKGYKRKTKYEKWGGEQLSFKGHGVEYWRAELLKIRNATSRRVASLRKKGIVSEAMAYLEQQEGLGKTPVSKMNYWQITAEVGKYHNFWSMKGSTESGAREINREQDIRIFGTDRYGRPIRTMTREERVQFWSLYSEFQNQYKAESIRYDSTRLQQMIGETLRPFHGGLAKNLDVVSVLNTVREKMEADFERQEAQEVELSSVNYTGGYNDLKSKLSRKGKPSNRRQKNTRRKG